MLKPYTLDDLDTSKASIVEKAILEIQKTVFPRANTAMISQLFADVVAMFEGTFWDYQAMDTAYHNLEHTMQATLCWARLIASRHLEKVEPIMSERDFENGLHALLLHDIGYLKERGDNVGTGAKYTFMHVQRSCELADLYLIKKDWSRFEIYVVQHIISCTGPRSIIDAVPFNNEMERIMGEAACAADYLGQMSDPQYKQKLLSLFMEFEESDDYRKILKEDRMFKSSEEILRSTPYFWDNIVIPKLDKDCHSLYKYLSQPYPDGVNPYLQKVEEHIATIRKWYTSLDSWERYFGKRSLNMGG